MHGVPRKFGIQPMSKGAVRPSYGDSAVHMCTVKAKVTPEHNVRKTQYAVTCNIDEECEKVLNLQCHDCAASSGKYF